MLLCDYAEVVNGKLYIMGGGWSRILRPNVPTSMGLAIKIMVPWDQTNTPHKIEIEALTEDGDPIILNGEPMKIEAGLEVGRPPGLKKGTPLDAPLAIVMPGVALDAGAYEWRLSVDGNPVARTTFTVAEEPPGGMQ